MTKVNNDNCLATRFPKIASEWHPTKNGDLMPNMIIVGSHIIVWWQDKKGHEWRTSVRHRTQRNHNCPYCVRKKVCIDNCLATLNPKISAEWHPTKNGDLTPYDVVSGSHKKVWWRCTKGHEWEASISIRIGGNRKGVNCPYCAGQKVCIDNCLATRFPKIASEWHPTKNGDLTPYDVVSGTKKQVWWKCIKGHVWMASLDTRTHSISGCPYCSNQKVCNDNCFAIKFPEIASEWHPIKNGELTPYDVVSGSDKKIWWKCIKGHEWQTHLYSRTSSNGKCPYCSNQKVCNDNCLATKFPKIASEWHPTKNGDLTPYDVVSGSDKKVWWICCKKHEWITSVKKRTRLCCLTCCPFCNESKSKGENKIAEFFSAGELKFTRQKMFSSCKCKNPLPFDFIIKTKKGIKAIEYQGEQHFFPISFFGGEKGLVELQKRDLIKKEWCGKRKIPLLTIPYWEYDNVENLLKDFIFNVVQI